MVLLVEEYFELTTKYKAIYGENTIVLMQVGAFFEVYGTKKKYDGYFHPRLLSNLRFEHCK